MVTVMESIIRDHYITGQCFNRKGPHSSTPLAEAALRATRVARSAHFAAAIRALRKLRFVQGYDGFASRFRVSRGLA
jgi:hypothetical protein